jgi:hypothetical protein
MFTGITRQRLVGLWVAILAVVAAAAVVAGMPLTIATGALWVVACVVPPGVMLMVWRGAPPPTIAEILHAVDRRE